MLACLAVAALSLLGGHTQPVLDAAQRRAFRERSRAGGWQLWTACR